MNGYKILSAYRENILILSEHVQIIVQIFDSEVILNYLYLSILPKWIKKKNCTWKKKDISEQYVSITGWVIFLEKWQVYFIFTIFPFFQTSTDFHVEAIARLCFVCGSIIKKNGHHILPVLKEAMSLTFERSINLLENVTPSNICDSCWRTVNQFSDQKKRGLCFSTSKTTLVWLPHSHTDCSTCDLYFLKKDKQICRKTQEC